MHAPASARNPARCAMGIICLRRSALSKMADRLPGRKGRTPPRWKMPAWEPRTHPLRQLLGRAGQARGSDPTASRWESV